MSFTISPSTTSMMDSLIRPRPIKHGNPLVSRTQSEEAGLKPSQGIDAIPSSISRYPRPLKCDIKHLLIYPAVAAQHQSPLMPLRRQNLSLWQENKSGHSKDIEFFLRSTTTPAFRILTAKAIIEISGVSSYYFGLGLQSWLSLQC